VPRHKEFRDVFGGVDGWSWMKADYSQIELRLAAWHADETTMLQAFRDGEDLHALTASNILGDPTARTVGKILNFGLLYGAGAGTLQRIARTEYDVSLTLNQAKEYRARFFETYPALKRWHRRLEGEITSSGKAVSPLGRIRHLPDALLWDDALKMRAVREGINHPIQSFASDMLLMALTRVHEQLDPAEAVLVAEVHDEMDLLVRNDSIDKVASLVKATMEDVSWVKRWGVILDVPIVAEVEIGTHWGSVSEWSST
jgi:DNA polymerase I-like protein with 3'-5' exonuclease and polymerase domains